MIGFFPEIYPDELVYSWFARFYQRAGYSAYLDAIKDLYESRTVRPDVEFINHLKADVKEVIMAIVPMDELITNHTMFPYYARFMPVERRKRAYQVMLDMDSNIHNELAIPNNRKSNGAVRHVRYCPLCAVEDRERYGETYIHRGHQLMDVDVCYRHHCLLKTTKIPISGKASPRLHVFDSVVEDMEAEPSDNERALGLARYVTEVFYTRLALDNKVGVGEFLHAKMAGTPYRSIRGQQRNISRLFEDYKNYYRDIPDKGITELWQLQKILNGYRWNTYEVCQLAMLLNVRVGELTDMSLPEKSQEEIFDDRVMELRSQGLKYPMIAEILGASINVVKPIGEGTYAIGERRSRPKNNGGLKRYDWDTIDDSTLPRVRKEIAEIKKENTTFRPKRLTVFAMEKRLGFPQGRMKTLRKCKAEIQNNMISQEEFWAQTVVWAANRILNDGETLNWKHVRKYTNMRNANFQLCKPYLDKYANKTMVQRIKNLI